MRPFSIFFELLVAEIRIRVPVMHTIYADNFIIFTIITIDYVSDINITNIANTHSFSKMYIIWRRSIFVLTETDSEIGNVFYITNKMFTVQYYPFLDIATHKLSRAEKILKIATKFCPSLKQYLTQLRVIRPHITAGKANEEIITELKLAGLYVLFKDESIVSIATISLNKINTICTLQRYRRKGYASKLITDISERMLNNKIRHVFCPVEPAISSMFQKMGWVKIGKTAPDGTNDYIPSSCIEDYTLISGYNYCNWLSTLAFLRRCSVEIAAADT